MATALGAQLATISAQSTKPLDLKSQKRAHSQSLLFDSRNAATQDFDTIYQICDEGFQELCHVDTRFAQFASGIFAEQSKQEDRTQMTAAQNRELDADIEKFLCLVGSKLLLRPAIKAVEWLVRRFRVHENNTLCFVLNFLPYHTNAIFLAVLSILPRSLPSTLRFLHPYVQSLTHPPRHTIVYTASQNRPFFSILGIHVLKISRMGYQYSTLASFWASIATEAAATMLDDSRSATLESQQQNQEDVIRYLLPILNEGLTMDAVPNLRVGCYMVLTVLATKADLDDDLLMAMMMSVTSYWGQTSHAGLICLSVLAQQKKKANLPRKVLEAILALERLDDDLLVLSKQYKVDRLVLGVVLGITSGLETAQDPSRLRLVRTLIEANLMEEASTAVAIKSILTTAQTLTLETTSALDVQGAMADILLRLGDSNTVGELVQAIVKNSELQKSQFGARLQRVLGDMESSPERTIDNADMDGSGGEGLTENFDALISQIPTKTAYELSFLSHSDSYVFSSLAHAFSSMSTSDADIEKFSDLPVLRRALASREPLFLSFFMRFWCGDSSTHARAAAIRTVSRYIEQGPLKADVQILLPYLIHALADPFSKVRRAAANLLLTLECAYNEVETCKQHADLPVLGNKQVYGQIKENVVLSWLSISETRKFLADLLVPGLEECLVDSCHVSQLLSDSLGGSNRRKDTNTSRKRLKTALRLAIFNFLGTHVINTPLYRVKHRLLQTLNRTSKVSSTSRTKLLLPLLLHCARQNQDEYERMCRREQLDPLSLLDQVVDIVIPTDREGIQILKAAIEPGVGSSFTSLASAALRRIQAIWPSIKPDLQMALANIMLKQALGEAGTDTNGDQAADTMEALRALTLSTTILLSFVEGLPSISSTPQDRLPTSKRRRISYGPSQELAIDSQSLSLAIKHITLVLDLVVNANPERHPELLQGLFDVMSNLQHPQSQAKAATDYLLVLTMDCMLAIVKQVGASSGLRIDHSAVRTDVLIDCVRITTSPQVRNTALLLVSALASVAPELVLHSVMPLFTYMSANLLRQEDDFSAYVVKQTMESVIPCLVLSLHKRRDGPSLGVSELLLSFAAAYDHIPIQRRLDLFASLVDKVGSDEYLFVLLAILAHKYPDDRRVEQFAIDLVSRFNVKVRLRTMERYLDVILDTRKPKPTFSTSILMSQNIAIESTIVNLLKLPTMILGSRTMAAKVTRQFEKGGEDAAIIRNSYEQLLEKSYLLAEEFSGNKDLDVSCMRIMDVILGLLPIRELIDTLQQLLAHMKDKIRQQVLRSFEHRLNYVDTNEQSTQKACLQFLPPLLSIVKDSPDVSLKNTVISCIDKISENFGKKDVPSIINSSQLISSDLCLGSTECSLRVSSLICLATMVEVTEDSFIPIVPYAFAQAMDNLANSIQEDVADTKTHNAVYTFISALVLYLPWAITGADLDCLLKTSYKTAYAKTGRECGQRRFDALQLIPRKLGAKEYFSALERTWVDAMSEGPLAVKEYLGMLSLAIDQYPKSVIVKESDTLGDLLLTLFDLRRSQLTPPMEDRYTLDEICEVEDSVNESAIAMVYKLNDATFRPLFSRILEWTSLSHPTHKTKTANKELLRRQATLYKFLLKFFDTLKSIVTSYAGFIIEDSVEILKGSPPVGEEAMFLWKQVILTLHKTFEHDQDDFYQSPSHFAQISAALLSQLNHAAHIPLLPELIPALTELAVATDSDTHQQEMNRAVLQYLRSDSSAVRLAAVQCERALTEKLGEEWLKLLSEILPFISEALEDDDESVEREVQRWKADIEGILGESLDPMLQ